MGLGDPAQRMVTERKRNKRVGRKSKKERKKEIAGHNLG